MTITRAHRTRPPLLASAVATAALAAAALSAAGTGHALETPATGVKLPLTATVQDATVTVDGERLRSGKLTGGMRMEVLPDPAGRDATGIPVATTGFRLDPKYPHAPGPRLTVEQADADVDSHSRIVRIDQRPPLFEHTWRVTLRVTLTRTGMEPVTLISRSPAELVGRLGQFPPQGEVYRLTQLVELADPDRPDETVATLDRLPVRLRG
ncbi:hypothetical protein LX16_3966 [Stackebrandtia albiflava]|uniref:Uncharacterized protein n=1 Tax=Stackebrandtia albiflava TaxID=406432 RepID=A0A562UY68_9ACTN|nr:hypothetical protein [Stackebrandtia albiflava]TWJ10547.1 hypothetical protein LX16_3966 [Stackebrandtia albiflava]